MRYDIVNSNPEAPKLDRREFLVTSIFAAGTFAFAVQPVVGQTRIVTDDKGLTAGEVKIPVADGQIPAYRAMPDKKGGKFPVVIVVSSNTNFLLDVLTELDNERAEKDGLRNVSNEGI